MPELIPGAYDPEAFRTQGHALVDLLARYLEEARDRKIRVLDWMEPDQQLEFWKTYDLKGRPVTSLFEDIIRLSNHMHHPRYMGHQVSPALPLTALSGLLGALVSNGMAVYEVGPSASAIEKVVVESFLKQLGFASGDGYITSGGTLANLTGLLAARRALEGADVWEEGQQEALGVMVSSEAHYCIERAVRIMGLGSRGIIRVPVDGNYRMDTGKLEAVHNEARERGIRILAVVGSAPSTATGMYDDLEAIAGFCRGKGLWFHVDGAHGGAAIFSEKYRHLLRGVNQADSVVIDGHKMMLMPVITTLLLFRDKKHAGATFSEQAQYLWEEQSEVPWHDISRKTFECTKHMMAIKYFVAMKVYGTALFEEHLNRAYDLGKAFGEIISGRKGFELFLPPDSNIVVFRYVGEGLEGSAADALNASIRQAILREGTFYVVQTRLKGRTWLRTALMNPLTTQDELHGLLDHIELQARKLVTGE